MSDLANDWILESDPLTLVGAPSVTWLKSRVLSLLPASCASVRVVWIVRHLVRAPSESSSVQALKMTVLVPDLRHRWWV